MPGEWKGMEKKFEEILMIRALRQDRISSVMGNWINFQLGPGFTDCDGALQSQEIVDDSFCDTDFRKPMMFVNAPGVNAVRMVKDINNENNKGELEIVAMGELMEKVAVQKIEEGKTSGTWVILENIQLMVEWLPELTKILEDISSGASGGFINNKFRLFLTTDPTDIMPIGIMERSILIIMEAPAGIKPNMQKAWKNFDSKKFEDKDGREKNILYGLCYFHAMMFERKRYGRIGYNMN
jgi:dynein heavy chain